ncbi:DUF4421 family protein [Chitinophaga skermanii]|uniref:DUF4421 family protein n=1 Tax=Chitinophaga skermanii TaxID=331697 RepID=UPI001313EE4D|nr:DUF4421 family protein [Chitinophaga skermanii]
MDTNFVRRYEKSNMIEVFTGLTSLQFNFAKNQTDKSDFRLTANSSNYIGVDVSYKWLYLQATVNIPGTQLDKNVNFHYTSLKFKFGTRKLIFQPFFNAYNGLLIPKLEHRSYEPFRNIHFVDVGLDMYYYTNARQFSHRAASAFSEEQVRSKGTFFFTASPVWRRISWVTPSRDLVPDSATYQLLSSNPKWVSLVLRGGYTYNIVPAKNWLIAPAIAAGGGALYELTPGNKSIQAVYDVHAWINTGYNGPRYYVYMNASWENLRTNFLIKKLRRVNSDISITFGYRFSNFKKKILGIL